MLKCPSCGFFNLDYRERCLKCKAALVHRDDLAPETGRIRKANLLAPILWVARRWARRISHALAVPLPQNVTRRYPFLAAFLGLVPGLGQIYNHQPKKVLYFVPVLVGTLAVTARCITQPYAGNLLIAASIAVPLVSYWDALVTAARINGQTFTLRNQLAALTYPFFLLGAIGCFCSLMTVMQWPMLTLFSIRKDYMEPGLRAGERIAGEGLSYLFRDPRPGDVVHYDPPSYSQWVGSDWYVVDARDGWERIMAADGEMLERREGIFYVDGRELAPAYHPLVTRDLPDNFRIDCPEGLYVVLISARVEDSSFIQQLRGGPTKAPELFGKDWVDACIVAEDGAPPSRAEGQELGIFERSLFVYYPTTSRRWLVPRGARFVD